MSNYSVDDQIKHWVKIAKIAEENPDLTYDLIKSILIARQEVQAGILEPYVFDEICL